MFSKRSAAKMNVKMSFVSWPAFRPPESKLSCERRLTGITYSSDGLNTGSYVGQMAKAVSSNWVQMPLLKEEGS